jgi:hypothetical protein
MLINAGALAWDFLSFTEKILPLIRLKQQLTVPEPITPR